MRDAPEAAATLPRALTSYPDRSDSSLAALLQERVAIEPFNAVATAIFVAAILHTFAASWFTGKAHHVQAAADARATAAGKPALPSVAAEVLHFLGEVEVVFGLWAVLLLAAMTLYAGWGTATHYFGEIVVYTEPLFVVVIMALAATRPIVEFAEGSLRRVAAIGGGGPAAWWAAILTVGPLLGSFITEPAAMTLAALILLDRFYSKPISKSLRYAALGVLFVNVSIGGTLTPFAAPPVLMVAAKWNWDFAFMAVNFGWKAALAVLVNAVGVTLVFRRELVRLPVAGSAPLDDTPAFVRLFHLGMLAAVVFFAHHPVVFMGLFLFFLGFCHAYEHYQDRLILREGLLVAFFLAGLVVLGGQQRWWLSPLLGDLGPLPMFIGATALTAITDNAALTYLGSLVEGLSPEVKYALVAGAVTGGGLTVIANAPNPAGFSLLKDSFEHKAIHPGGLFVAALLPTLVAAAAFLFL
jgi:hypothetical protein